MYNTIFNQFGNIFPYMRLCHSLNRIQLYQQKTKPTTDSFPSHLSSGHIQYRDHLILKTESFFYIHTKIITTIMRHILIIHTRSMCPSRVCYHGHACMYVRTTSSLLISLISHDQTIQIRTEEKEGNTKKKKQKNSR